MPTPKELNQVFFHCTFSLILRNVALYLKNDTANKIKKAYSRAEHFLKDSPPPWSVSLTFH